jgi:hypothetical protein
MAEHHHIPSAAWAWLFWLLLACAWVIMLAGVSAVQEVTPSGEALCLQQGCDIC